MKGKHVDVVEEIKGLDLYTWDLKMSTRLVRRTYNSPYSSVRSIASVALLLSDRPLSQTASDAPPARVLAHRSPKSHAGRRRPRLLIFALRRLGVFMHAVEIIRQRKLSRDAVLIEITDLLVFHSDCTR